MHRRHGSSRIATPTAARRHGAQVLGRVALMLSMLLQGSTPLRWRCGLCKHTARKNHIYEHWGLHVEVEPFLDTLTEQAQVTPS